MMASDATYWAPPLESVVKALFRSLEDTSEVSPNRLVTRHELFEETWAATLGWEFTVGTVVVEDGANRATPVCRYTEDFQ